MEEVLASVQHTGVTLLPWFMHGYSRLRGSIHRPVTLPRCVVVGDSVSQFTGDLSSSLVVAILFGAI